MKHTLYLKIAAMLCGIAVIALSLTAVLNAVDTAPAADDELHIVASFYPVYIAAKNVAGNIDGVQVTSMVEGQTGCLHDYQMSPADRAAIETADIFVMNGAGAEPFLSPVLATLPDLPVIDLSAGQALLENGHVHEHEHEYEHHGGNNANSHLWVSPLRYRGMVETLRDALCKADPAHAAQYTRQAALYIEQIDAVWARLQQAASAFVQTPAALFHDSLAYLAEDLGLTVAVALNVGEDSGVSASELREAENALSLLPQALYLYDTQYDTVSYTYLQQLPARAITLRVNTATAGEDTADAWLIAMTALCEEWEAAA